MSTDTNKHSETLKFSFKRWWDTGMQRPVKFFASLTMLCTAIVFGIWLPGHISVTLTKSLKHRIFFLQDSWNTIEQGDYVMFRHLTPWTDKNPTAPTLIIKIVGCAPGQHLSVNASKEYFCNGQPLGTAIDQDSLGNKLPQFHFNGVIPPGKLFVIGQHKRSYDSKYYGFIDADKITRKAIPLI